MKYPPGWHLRRSSWLDDYDFCMGWASFVTMSAQEQLPLFGEMQAGQMQVNNLGKMVARWFREIEKRFPETECDEFVCMPNHIHFILACRSGSRELRESVEAGKSGFPFFRRDKEGSEILGGHLASPLHEAVKWLSVMASNEYFRRVKHFGGPIFSDGLFQSHYYEYRIFTEYELNRIRRYIINNPSAWNVDPLRNGTGTPSWEDSRRHFVRHKPWMV